MYTLLGYFHHAARLAADMWLSDLRYPINFVVKHQIPLYRGGPALRLLKPAESKTAQMHRSDPSLLLGRSPLDEGTELDAVNEVGGADRDRTGDPLLAKQVLSQLSYSPFKGCVAKMVGLGRFELPTSPLSGVRSNQLSYRPALRAPPPISCRRLAQISFNAKGFRGQRLNMLSSYATHDDRKNLRPGKEGLYRISCARRLTG